MATKKFEYTEDTSDLARTVLMVLPAISQGERLRLASTILLPIADRNGGKVEMRVETDEHLYTLTVDRQELSEQD